MLTRAALSELLARQSSVTDFNALIELAELTLATDLLVPFAHWITPVDQPKRFDTHFFLAPVPPDQVAMHDGREAIVVHWLTPEGAIAAARPAATTLLLPTPLT